LNILELEHVTKKFGSVVAVDDLSLAVTQGEFLTLLGPSGCGKTTTLRLIAGLEMAEGGEIRFGGRKVFSYRDGVFVPPRKRNLGLVFQNYALWPHMTVFENVAFGLKVKRMPKTKIQEAVKRTLDYMHLVDLERRYPHELSGGQQQRVAVARMIVNEPKIFLMDEPLSNLDAKLRLDMRTEIKRLHNDLEATTIYVTHDQVEALTLATRVVVMNDGIVEQSSPPSELYGRPANLFVADFVGSPPMNLVEGKLIAHENGIYLEGENLSILTNLPPHMADRIVLGAIRPEDATLSSTPLPEAAIAGTVYSALPAGPETIIQVKVGNQRLTVLHEKTFDMKIGVQVYLFIPPEKLLFYDKETGKLISTTTIPS
jgi:multiple sugar transport system ATP-binding protein